MLDPRKKPHIKIQPPFIRPDLSDRQITIKISDNGVHGTIISSKVSCLGLLHTCSFWFPCYPAIRLTHSQSFPRWCFSLPHASPSVVWVTDVFLDPRKSRNRNNIFVRESRLIVSAAKSDAVAHLRRVTQIRKDLILTFDPKGIIDLICFFVHSVLLLRQVWKICCEFSEGLSSEVENNALVQLFQFFSSTGMWMLTS